MQVRVRMAPSPTGTMHVGTARTALFNWLFARKNGGVFILRIEDTDKERSKKQYEDDILDALEWLGLDFEEGPIKNQQIYKGAKGPYRQSERTEIYHMYLKKLLDEDLAFWCYHTREELEQEKTEQETRKQALRHVCGESHFPHHDVGSETPHISGIIRFKNPDGKIKFHDLVKGDIEFDAALLGDFSIAKSLDEPLYNFAVVIDDYGMEISHVIRGDDHLSNTPKQILMQRALGFSVPIYAHIPMILGPDKSKLSKRHGATSLLEYKNAGYLPDAMFNFLSFLGWNPGGEKEILSRKEIVEQFSLEHVQKSGAVFNIEKLDWLNGEYMNKMPLEELAKLCIPYVPETNFEFLKQIAALEQPRMKKISDITESAEFFFKDTLVYDRELLKWKDMNNEEAKEVLEKLERLLDETPEKNYTKEKLEETFMVEANKMGDRGKLLWPLRVALTGRKASPGPFEVAEILGKKKCLARLREAKRLP